MSLSGAIAAVKASIDGADANINETPDPLRNGLAVAPRANFDTSFFLGIEADGRPDEHGIQPAGQERARCRLSVQLGCVLDSNRNSNQATLQGIAQKVTEALHMLVDSNIVYLYTEDRPVVLQEDRRLVWANIWTLVYRI